MQRPDRREAYRSDSQVSFQVLDTTVEFLTLTGWSGEEDSIVLQVLVMQFLKAYPCDHTCGRLR